MEQDEARRFRKKAMKMYGYGEGTIKRASEDVIRRFSTYWNPDWKSLKSKLKTKKNVASVELQHMIWSRQD
ncbi:hypothetical protein KEJ39_01175 [Candidatus Bathyarchaeota archaeon]|nr:hypothetical protein [Candidatus Bathyarchaeota archaeon]